MIDPVKMTINLLEIKKFTSHLQILAHPFETFSRLSYLTCR